METYEAIGKRLGALISGGEVDINRVSNQIISDLRTENIKGITFDRI
jgi:ribosome biogenesis GTPase A